MLPRVLRHFKKMETAKAAVLTGLRGWPQNSLQHRAESGGWSALDVIEHLALTEHFVVAAMRSNISNPRAVRVMDWLRNGIVMGAMVLPVRVRIPAGAGFVAPTGRTADLTAIIDRWNTVRLDLAGFLNGVRESDLNGGVVRHPAGGWTTIEGALWFMRAHLRHHRYQVSRIGQRLRNEGSSPI